MTNLQSALESLVDHAQVVQDISDPLEVLRVMATYFPVTVQDVLDQAVHLARFSGASWADIAAELGVSKQAAWERYADRPDQMTTPAVHAG